MGTTADKLQAVLNSKNAIRDKFNLGDIPFSQYAENINAGTVVTSSAEYFKCASVDIASDNDSGTTGDSGSGTTSASTDIIVSGFSDDRFNGIYTLEDAAATGIYRVWVKDGIRLQTAQDTDSDTAMWRFLTDEWNNEDNPCIGHSHLDYANPWDATEWMLYTDYHGISGTVVVTQASSSGSTTFDLPEPVFYYSMTEQADYAETGQMLATSSDLSITEIDGRKCVAWRADDELDVLSVPPPFGITDTTNITIGTWIYHKADIRFFYFCLGNTVTESLALWWEPSINGFKMGSLDYESGGTTLEFPIALTPDTWYYITLVYGSGKLTIYVDGIPIIIDCTWTYRPDGSLHIGCYREGGVTITNDGGYQSQFSVYGTALNQKQVAKLYKQAVNPPPITSPTWSGYKAILKPVRETVTVSGTDIAISGFVGTCAYMNGTYILSNPTAAGTSRIWTHSEDETRRLWCDVDIGNWRITDATSEDFPLVITLDYPPPDDPVSDESWAVNNPKADAEGVQIKLSAVTTTETKIKKYYTFEDTLTEGLTYGDGFTPVVGKVYDRKAMVEATLFTKD